MKLFLPLMVAISVLVAGQAWAAPLTVSKSASVVSDPINGVLLPKVIPGAVVDYTIQVQNPNTITVPRAIVVTDRITDVAVPQGAEYFVGNLNAGNSGPIAFNDGSLAGIGGSTLVYTYTSLSSATDSLAFSNDGGATWTYTPVPNGAGYDAAVTHIRVSPAGNFAVLSGFSFRLRVRIRQ